MNISLRALKVELGRTHGKAPCGQMTARGEKGRAHEVAAKAVGLSPKTFQRAVKIIEKAPEELK